MAYQINKTDGTIVATVADGQVDTFSTDLTLIGKNYSGFGEALNEDLVKLLENFASTAAPTKPIRGQIWFDTAENKLKVYNGTSFIPVSSATISNTQPNTLSIGDLWFDNAAAQLYFFDGITPILLGPAYSSTQGLSGLRVDSILDTLNQTRVITYFYNNGVLLGIFAKDSFTPKIEIVGYVGTIEPGFNAGSLSGIKFNVTCTNSDKLGGVVAATYVRTDIENQIITKLQIKNDSGVLIGTAQQMQLYVNNGDIYITNAAFDKKTIINALRGNTTENSVEINSANRTISLYSGFADSITTIGGNLVVNGNLTVEGSTTTLNTTDLTIEDKNIIISSVDSPTDSTADGAGITIKGTTDKTVIYSEADNWLDISETLNLASGKAVYIGGTKVIDGNSLGSAITSIPGVSSFGKQTVLNIGPGSTIDPAWIRLENNRLSTVSSNYNLELAPDGTGNVALIGSPYITGLASPPVKAYGASPDGYEQYATSREYVDSRIENRPLIFTMDLSDGKSNTYIIANILNNLAPVAEYRAGTVARILCTLISNSTTTLSINSLPPALSTSAFLTDLSGNSANALTNISFPTATISAPSVSTTRIVKVFQIFGGVWTWQSDTVLPA